MDLPFARAALRLFFCSILSSPIVAGGLNGLSIDALRTLAKQGEPSAQVEMGLMYQYGEGLAKDSDQAINWYCRAAYQGSISGQRNLAWLYLSGEDVPRDEAAAAHWFKLAADQGDPVSERMLQRLDSKQEGVNDVCAHVAHPRWLEQRCRRADCRRIIAMVERLAPEYGLDTNLVLGVIEVESSFKTRVCSGKKACGVMQLIPMTAKRFGVNNLKDPEQNIRGGMAYLRWLLAYFQGNLRYALAGYNAGEGSVVKYRGVPPYRETLAYVKRIIEDYGRSRHSYRKDWIKPSRIMTSKVAQLSAGKPSGVL